jgi:hypothetical protein
MKRVVVTFWGEGRDSSGMPIPFHRYYILASDSPRAAGIGPTATIVADSGGPSPLSPHFVSPRGSSVDDVIAQALEVLGKLNPNLDRDVESV